MALLEIEDITQYFGGLCALSDFNLSLRRVNWSAIIGPNGAGKTTVFNLITGVYRPKRGKHRDRRRQVVGTGAESDHVARHRADVSEYPACSRN